MIIRRKLCICRYKCDTHYSKNPTLNTEWCFRWSPSLYLCGSSHCILGMLEETMQPLQGAQSKSVSPALLIRGPAISVWVVVLWCKDSKMSGSLVDQVNHALSLKQWSSAVAIIALTSWLTDCFTANTWSCGWQWLSAMHTETWEINVYKQYRESFFSCRSLQSIINLTHKHTSISCWSVLKSPNLKGYFSGICFDVSPF